MIARSNLRQSPVFRGVVAVAALIGAAMPLIAGPETVTVMDHHLEHAVLLLGGILFGMTGAWLDHRHTHGETHPIGWLFVALLAPMGIMFLMDPATYAYIEAHTTLHTLDHIGLEALAALTAYAGQRYGRRVGFVMSAYLELMAVASAFGFGVVHPLG